MTAHREPERSQPFWVEVRTRHVFTIAALLALAILLLAARSHLGPYIFGAMLAYFLLPIVRRIESLFPQGGRLSKSKRGLSTIAAVLLTIGAAVLLVTLLAKPVVEELDELEASFPGYVDEMTTSDSFGDWYTENVPEDVQNWVQTSLSTLVQQLLQLVVETLEFFFNATGSVVSAVAGFVMVPVFMAYFLIDRPGAKRWIRSMLPEPWVDDTVEVLRIADRLMASYTRGVLVSSVVVGTITGLGYWIIGVELWVALGVIAFLGEIVPILGPWIAFLISFPVILITQPEKAIPAVVLFGVIQALEGWFISPRIQADSIEFPTAVVLVALAIGGAVAGGIGVVLALPVAAIARALLVYTMRRLNGVRPAYAAMGILPGSHQTVDDTG